MEIIISVGLSITIVVSSEHELGSDTVTVYEPADRFEAVDDALTCNEVLLSTQENWYGVPLPPDG